MNNFITGYVFGSIIAGAICFMMFCHNENFYYKQIQQRDSINYFNVKVHINDSTIHYNDTHTMIEQLHQIDKSEIKIKY